MTIVTNTDTTYLIKGIREDLSDYIGNISPTDTPFSTMIGKGPPAENTFFEWQTDALASADTTNAQLEGDDVGTFQTNTPTTRVGNRAQISNKTLVMSGTADAVNKAGRKMETAYQLVKRTKELKRDMEAILTTNQASVAGNGTTARKTGSLRAWYSTNSNLGATGSNGGFQTTNGLVATATDGTQRVLTEALLKAVILAVFSSGGDPDTVMTGPFNKQAVSGFTGNATRMIEAEDRKLIAAIDVYASDFGEMKIVPNRFQRERDVHVLQTDMWSISYLRPMFVQDLARTGDATKKELIVEFGLRSNNEAASGIVADITTS